MLDVMEETGRRMGGDNGSHPGAGAVEMFAGVRIEGHASGVIERVGRFQPDLIIAESFDAMGPLTAAALHVPWVEHKIVGPVPAGFARLFEQRAQHEYDVAGLQPTGAVVAIDPYPDTLLTAEERDERRNNWLIRPSVHRDEQYAARAFGTHAGSPVALVTFGTSVSEEQSMADVAESVAQAGFQVLVTVMGPLPVTRSDLEGRIRTIGFVPLSEVLPQVDVVISAGGTGTLLASLSESKPLVILPFLADQPWNAQRAAEAGTAIIIARPDEAGAAALKVLETPEFAEAVHTAQDAIRRMDTASTVVERLESQFGQRIA
jgi:UDP:flavonoid glycosyltransferase YjiC (YdhE family)